MQLPMAAKLTVLAATVQTGADSELKVTGFPDCPPVADKT